MGNWIHRVKIKHLFTEKEDYESIQESMNAIADVLKRSGCFFRFDLKKFRNIPKGDEVFGPADYANKLLARMYDYADDNQIWIE
jgi:hypothetical protein